MNLFKNITIFAALSLSTTITFSQDAETLMKMGQKLEMANLHRDAVLKYDMIIAMNEGDKYNLEAYYYRANYKKKKGKSADAINDYSSAIELSKKIEDESPALLSRMFYNMAKLKLKNLEYEEVIWDLDKVVEYAPRNAEAYAMRGNAKFLLKDKIGACADFTEARLLNNNIIDENYEEAYSKSMKKCK